LSQHDSLTGLHNRHYFEDYFRRLEENIERPATILSCDLDNLKKVNDAMGHTAGDLLLQGAAGILRASFRAEDVVARIGGDEFVVVLRGGSQEQIDTALERVRAHEEAWNRKHPGMNLSISIGAASTATDMDLKGVLKLADDRMYADKARRKAQKG
jgi:diguanylate cyclase (GGDEF)-like protein